MKESDCLNNKNKVDIHNIDTLPLDLLPLLIFDDFKILKFWSTQGRWNDYICFKILNSDVYSSFNNSCIPKGVSIHEPGFAFLYELPIPSTSAFYTHFIGNLFSVDVNRTLTNIQEFKFPYVSDSPSYLYYGNPLDVNVWDDNLYTVVYKWKNITSNTPKSKEISLLVIFLI